MIRPRSHKRCRKLGIRQRAAWLILAGLVDTFLPCPSSASPMAASLEGRFSIGYDSNLLDASAADRAAFASGNPKDFFVVNAMEDEFIEGQARCVLRFQKLAARPSLKLGYERRQYVDNPVKSSDRYSLDAVARLGARTRATLAVDFQPTLYLRHRRDDYAQPGE